MRCSHCNEIDPKGEYCPPTMGGEHEMTIPVTTLSDTDRVVALLYIRGRFPELYREAVKVAVDVKEMYSDDN